MSSSRPRLVVIGRPNVGKSTLFNRLLGRRRALVHDMPGVTRDRLEEEAIWWVRTHEYPVALVDTGGLGGERFAEEIARQVATALEEADVALVVFDGRAGFTSADGDVIRQLRQKGLDRKIPVLGVVNKVDAEVHEELIADFYAAGLDRILTISAEHNRGIDDLQEAVADALDERFPLSALRKGADIAEEEAQAKEGRAEGAGLDWEEVPLDESDEGTSDDGEETAGDEAEADAKSFDELHELEDEPEDPRERRAPRIAIVGRPNVGKSTLTNALLREERMITSPIAGTTVDSVESVVELAGRSYVLIDTAGIRRKSKTEQGIEVLSVVQARKALERCDVAILVLDGEHGLTEQDEKIGGLIEEVGCGVILAVNKWDTQRKNREFTQSMAAEWVRKEIAFLKYAPLMFLSAKERRGFEHLGELVDDILEERKTKIATREFTEWVRREAEIHNPFGARFYLCHQSGRHPPTFVCHVNEPKKVHFSLQRHLLNAMRERWGFMGNPVRLLFVKGRNARR